jgi:hypothetical protein
MDALTTEGKVYMMVREESLNGLHTIEFLAHLMQQSSRARPVELIFFMQRSAEAIIEGYQLARGHPEEVNH